MTKFSFHSIKIQILVAFVMLVFPLLALSYFYSLAHKIFYSALGDLVETEKASRILSEVEKNVLDLQRNVLIFKETASAGAEERVNDHHQDIDTSLMQLMDMPSTQEHVDSIGVMRNHLEDFKSNFDIVVGMRKQRAQLIEKHMGSEIFKKIAQLTAALPEDAVRVAGIENKVSYAHNASLAYFTSYDFAQIETFSAHTNDALALLKPMAGDTAVAEAMNKLQAYEKNFSRIVALTRHYVYLINVVMTGSANEILYHSAHLDDIYQERANQTRNHVSETMENQLVWHNILSLVGLLVAAMVAVLFYQRITMPIERITRVFKELADDQAVESIPELSRKDEIGMLASAADVFKSKNEQTTRLLKETERMVGEQKLLNEQLGNEKRRAEKALSIKTDFLANMSHELRTPLNSIIGFTVRLLRKNDDFSSKHFSALDAIERNGRHLLAMINDILDLSKIEANKLELKVISVDMNELCSSCVTQLSTTAEDKGLVLAFDGTLAPPVETDPARMSQILLNLLSNAVKYTEQGEVRLQLHYDPHSTFVVVKVTDTGIGISDSDQTKLFKRFEQFNDNTRFNVGQGTGLGLAIVANVSRLLGASIAVSSELGKGSCFTVNVPLVFQDDLPLAAGVEGRAAS